MSIETSAVETSRASLKRKAESGRRVSLQPADGLDLNFGEALLAEGRNIVYGDGEHTILERPDGSKKILTPGDHEQDLS